MSYRAMLQTPPGLIVPPFFTVRCRNLPGHDRQHNQDPGPLAGCRTGADFSKIIRSPRSTVAKVQREFDKNNTFLKIELFLKDFEPRVKVRFCPRLERDERDENQLQG